MLIQSHEGTIALIPTLPKKWSYGSFRGLCARGGYEVDIAWEDFSVTEINIKAKFPGAVTIELPETQKATTFKGSDGNEYPAVDGKLTLNKQVKLCTK